jgi:hypothetical protein
MVALTFAFDCKRRRTVSVSPRKEAAIMGDQSQTLRNEDVTRTFELQELGCSEQDQNFIFKNGC